MASVRLASAAYVDLDETLQYYESVHQGLGQEFLTCAEAAFELISRHPQLANMLQDGLLWIRMQRFPYKVIYRYDCHSDTVMVLGLFHHRRDPRKWPKR